LGARPLALYPQGHGLAAIHAGRPDLRVLVEGGGNTKSVPRAVGIIRVLLGRDDVRCWNPGERRRHPDPSGLAPLRDEEPFAVKTGEGGLTRGDVEVERIRRGLRRRGIARAGQRLVDVHLDLGLSVHQRLDVLSRYHATVAPSSDRLTTALPPGARTL